MARAESTLAKLTRPRLHEALARERLFSRLDDSRTNKPAICVVGPPGAGKTTLAATWLDARKIPGLWYQVDPGDTDVATFFYYLGEAAASFAKKARRKLPVLAPEYQHDIPGFSRRFFRELFGLLPKGSVVVLDNYQEVEAGQQFHELIAEAVEEVPNGSTLLAISRRDPPDCYARLIANEHVGFIDWEDLKLNLDEALGIIKARLSNISDGEIQRLHAESEGWAAGLTLIVNSYGRRGTGQTEVPIEHDSIFSYFATQIFEQLPTATKQFLVSTAIPPQLPVSLAQDLTGNPGAANILEEMYRRHFFTHRRSGAEPTYWYHALFREFLKSKADEVLTEKTFSEIERRAARLLEARQDFDDAFQLFHDTGDWAGARRLIERHAQTLLAQGRGQTLSDWVSALPAGIVDDAPWLRYWLGTSLIPLDQPEARIHLERAFGQFAASADPTGQTLSAAGIIDSYFFEWSDFRPMHRWVEVLASLYDRAGYQNNPEVERKIYSSLLIGMLYAAPGHRLLPHVVERVTEMLDEDMDVNSKVSIAIILLSYANISCDVDRSKITVARAEPLLEHEELTPFNRVWWYLRKGYYLCLIGQYSAGFEALDHAVEFSEAHGLQSMKRIFMLIASYEISAYTMIGDAPNARKWHHHVTEAATPTRPMDRFHVSQSRAHVETAFGNHRAVAHYSQEAAQLGMEAGMPYLEMQCWEHHATALAVLGDLKEMESAIARLRGLISETCFTFFECQVKLLEAYVELVHHRSNRARAVLADYITFARQHNSSYAQMARYSIVTGVVLAEALRSSIEPDYVLEVIHRYQIRPPADAPATWPWPVKIHALGRFDIELDGQVLEFSGKAPRRVLALLKAIVAAGPAPVSASRLIDTLWSDEEGDAARKALEVALVRLRKLLGHSEAVIVRDEQISLNRTLCWVDAWAFSKLVDMVESSGESVQDIARVGSHAMEFYRGNLLPAEEERSIIVARLRLRDQLARLVATLGQQLEADGRWDEALACYRRGIDADELAEEFYQGLMRCHAASGRTAEGIAVYRRLRQTLSVVLGVNPSAQTEQLVQLLRSEQPESPT